MLLLLATLCSPAAADDGDIVIIDDPVEERRPRRERRRRAPSEEVIREIERGTWVRADVGGLGFLDHAALHPGVSSGLSVGHDLVDQERRVVSVEGRFFQGAHQGLEYDKQGKLLREGLLEPRELVQGDSQVMGATLGVRTLWYPLRRLGLGVHASGGLQVLPLLSPEDTFTRKAVNAEWGGTPSVTHDRPLFLAEAGPTLEYYTKLAHLSVGADLDLGWTAVIGSGLGGSAWVKYTF